MAEERGWWTLEITAENPNQTDLDHIGDMVKQGYTSGEVTGDDDEE